MTQTEAVSEQDVRVVPGTRWVASVTMERNEYVSCQINLNVEDGVRVRYTIGSKGALVLLLNECDRENNCGRKKKTECAEPAARQTSDQIHAGPTRIGGEHL